MLDFDSFQSAPVMPILIRERSWNVSKVVVPRNYNDVDSGPFPSILEREE